MQGLLYEQLKARHSEGSAERSFHFTLSLNSRTLSLLSRLILGHALGQPIMSRMAVCGRHRRNALTFELVNGPS